MRCLLAILFSALATVAIAQNGRTPVQSGNVTPGHGAYWVAPGVLADVGAATLGKLSTLGLTANAPNSFCIVSAPPTAVGSQQFCMGATTAGGAEMSITHLGAAAAQPFTITLNGSSYQLPFSGAGTGNVSGPVSSTTGHFATWNNNLGTLLGDTYLSVPVSCDGSDDTVAIQGALNSAIAPAVVTLSSGICEISSSLTRPVGVSLVGAGNGATEILVVSNNVTAVITTSPTITTDNATISNLTINCGTTTQGTGISEIRSTNLLISNVTVAGCPTSIFLNRANYAVVSNVTSTGTSNQGAGGMVIESNLDTQYIFAVSVSNYTLFNVGTGVQATGIYCRRCVNTQITNFNANDLNTGGTARNGIVIENDSQGTQIVNANMSLPAIGVLQQTGAGVNVPPEFNTYTNINLDRPSTNGFSIASGAYTTISGGLVTGSGGTTTVQAIAIAGSTTMTSITGVMLQGFNGSGGACLGIGSPADVVLFSENICQLNANGVVWAGTSDNTSIVNNIFSSVTNPMVGTTIGVNNIISGNIGYNPVGTTSAVTVGTSPATIKAGSSRETHYLNQSATNTATVTKGGQRIAALVNASTYYTVDLGPNESMIVTWATTAPTDTKDVH